MNLAPIEEGERSEAALRCFRATTSFQDSQIPWDFILGIFVQDHCQYIYYRHLTYLIHR